MNHKKVQRLWREESLRVPQRRRRKRHGTSTAADVPTADAPNRVWAVDFQFDVTTDGRPIKIVSIIDEHTRECLGGMVERNITGEHLIAEFDRLAAERGTYPTVLRCDNGPELACSAMADWAAGQVGLHFIPPEPWRNGYVESFNSRVRDECLNINSFWSLAQARVIISDWKHEYNHHRGIRRWATNRQPATLPPVPTNERLSFAVDQITGSGQDRNGQQTGMSKQFFPIEVASSLNFSSRVMSAELGDGMRRGWGLCGSGRAGVVRVAGLAGFPRASGSFVLDRSDGLSVNRRRCGCVALR